MHKLVNLYVVMGQSLAQIYLHIIFSTKHRQAFLKDTSLREQTHAYMAGICRNLDCPALVIGGVDDHVHLLCRLGKQVSVSEIVRELKRDSSKWIKEQSSSMAEFHWQAGYGAFSVSPGHVDDLRTYITNQAEHHRHETFQEEFRRICGKYGIEINEQYAWD